MRLSPSSAVDLRSVAQQRWSSCTDRDVVVSRDRAGTIVLVCLDVERASEDVCQDNLANRATTVLEH